MIETILKSLGLLKNKSGKQAQFNLQGQNSEQWLNRAEIAVSFLRSIKFPTGNKILKIADLGCGDRKIEYYLQKANFNFEYTGYDIMPQRDDIRAINLNEELPNQSFDVIFCLGVLEYINNIDIFLGGVREIAEYLVLSYTVADSGRYKKEELQKYGWQHHYRINEIDHICEKNGFTKKKFMLIDHNRIALWLLKGVK